MIGMSKATIGKYIKQLVEAGYLSQRRNPKYKWDKTLQYRVDLYKIQKDLAKLGYALEGYKLLPGIKISDTEEVEVEEIIEEDDKKASVLPQTEANKELETFKNSKNSIPQNQKSNNKKLKTRYHNIPQTYENYGEEELEQLLLESQKGKFEFVPSYRRSSNEN